MPDNRPHIHVIGAGATGLTATVGLADLGIRVTLSEAEPRFGGKVRTLRINGYPMDLGAGWNHNGPDNALIKWGVERYARPDKAPYDADGIFSDIERHFRTDSVDSTLTITPEGLYSSERWRADLGYIEKRAETLLVDGKDISIGELAEGNEAAIIRAEYMATCWMALPNAYEHSYRQYLGDDTGDGGYVPRAGMQSVLAPIEREIKGLNIPVHTNCRIARIVENEKGCVLTSSRGRQFTADYVLFTGPEPALRKIHAEPALSSSPHIISSLNDAVRTHMNKMFIPLKPEFFVETAAGNIRPDTHIRMLKEKPYVFGLRPAAPFVILFVGGDFAKKMEYWRQSKIEAFADSRLDTIPGFAEHRKYRAGPVVMTRHYRKFRCSYSALRVGGKEQTGPLLHGKRTLLASADLASFADGAGTLGGAARMGVAATKILAAMCRNG